MSLERFSLDCRKGLVLVLVLVLLNALGWLVYLLWFWFYDSQVKTTLSLKQSLSNVNNKHIHGCIVIDCVRELSKLT